MKRAKTMLGTLAFVGLGFLFAVPANAADYSGNCAGVTAFNGTGNVTITDSNCTLPQSITATGSVSISATSISGSGKDITAGAEVSISASGGNIDLGDVESGNGSKLVITATGDITTTDIRSSSHAKIASSGGKVDVGTVDSNISGNNGNVLIKAYDTVKTSSISTVGGSGYGAVEIRTKTGGGNALFTIGGSGQSNGVNGSITTSPTTGGGSETSFMHGGVYVTNGDSSSTGGITLVSMSNLQIAATASRSGLLILDARNGTLTLPTGKLNADGPSGYMAGFIQIGANTITTADGTILSASQTAAATGSYHGVAIAADTINITGSSGLTINADGNGISGWNGSALAVLFPKGALSFTSNDNEEYLLWTTSWTWFNTDRPLSVSGSGAPIKLTANGDYTLVGVSGNGITFDNGDVTLEAKGDTSHEIYMSYYGNFSGPDIEFTGTGDVEINVSGLSSDNGGNIYIYGHTVNVEKDISFKADAETEGDGGQIVVSTSWDTDSGFKLDATKKATFSANGAGSGDAIYSASDTYDPKAITFYPGDNTIYLGTNAGQMTFSAKGGDDGGDGGAVITSASDIQLKTVDAVNVSAPGGNGKGGGFFSFAYITAVDSAINGTVIDASGHGTGIGGKFQSYHNVSNLNLEKLVKVDGGDSLLTAEENDFGRITLNSIACQQRTTGQGSWPKAYWNCTHPDESTSNEKLANKAAQKLHSTMKSNLGTQKVQIYLMNDISEFVWYHNVAWPTYSEGIAGYSDVDLKVSAAFKFELYSSGNKNVSSFYTGTIIHELGHQLDENVWGDASQNNATWLTKYNSDNTAFDTGYPGTCTTNVDDDRTDASVLLPAICQLFDGNGNLLKTNSLGLHDHGGGWFLDKRERFARAFENAYQRAYPSDIFVQVYDGKVDARLTQEQGYMDTMIGNGAP